MLRYTKSGPGARLALRLRHDDAEREVAYDRELKSCSSSAQFGDRWMFRPSKTVRQEIGNPAGAMFLQTSGYVPVLGECRLVESFALPVENKSLAELLDF